MTVSYVADGAAGVGTTSAATTLPAGIASGDLVILACTSKYTNIDAPSGWTLLQSSNAGHGSAGVDSGDAYIDVYYRIYDGVWTAPTVNLTGGNSLIAKLYAWTKTAGTWDLASTVGSDSTPGTSWSATGAANLSLTTDDRVFAVSSVNANDANVRASSHAVTATGATIGSASEKYDSGTNNGDDCSQYAAEAAVTAGPSTSAPTYTNTSVGSGTDYPAGPTVFVRVRASVTGATMTTSAGVATASGGTGSMVATGTNVTMTTEAGSATAGGGTGRMIGPPRPRVYRNLSPRTKVPPLSIFHSTS